MLTPGNNEGKANHEYCSRCNGRSLYFILIVHLKNHLSRFCRDGPFRLQYSIQRNTSSTTIQYRQSISLPTSRGYVFRIEHGPGHPQNSEAVLRDGFVRFQWVFTTEKILACDNGNHSLIKTDVTSYLLKNTLFDHNKLCYILHGIQSYGTKIDP